MSTERTMAKGIRLPDSLWEAIDREAQALKMSRNEYLTRRLGGLFLTSATVQKTSIAVRENEIKELADA